MKIETSKLLNFYTQQTNLAKTSKAATTTNDTAITPEKFLNHDLHEVSRLKILSVFVQQKLDKVESYVNKLTDIVTKYMDDSLFSSQRDELTRKFDKLTNKLQNTVENTKYGDKLVFDGNINIDATKKLGDYILTGADNQPTTDQATLTIPDLFAGLNDLSLTNEENAYNSYSILKNISDNINTAKQDLGDFNTSLDFAKNSILGIPNLGPSITQINLIKQSDKITDAATSAISQIQATLFHLKDLTVQAQDDSFSDADRQVLNQEFSAYKTLLDRSVANTSPADGVKILNEDYQLDLFTSPLRTYLDIPGISTDVLKEMAKLQLPNWSGNNLLQDNNLNVLTTADARTTMGSIDSALEAVKNALQNVKDFQFVINGVKDNINASLQQTHAVGTNILA